MIYNNRVTGEIISELRRERRLSQEVLSGLASIPRSHLSMIETGRKSANVETLWKIADALDISLSDLIRMVETKLESEQS